VHTTHAGVQCQAWSEQRPHQHIKTHANYPRSGLGGHNYCRNPDGEPKPWCYTVDESLRWDYCTVGKASETACMSPPPPSPSPPSPSPHPPPPPRPPPPPPPPVPCPVACAQLGTNGRCDAFCNTTTCLWDSGECRDILDAVLGKAKLGRLDASRLGSLISGQGGYLTKSMWAGLALGLVIGLCATVSICYVRRKKRLARRKPAARGARATRATP